MDQSFHYLLMATHSLFHRRVMAELSQAELTSGQPKVLDYLACTTEAHKRQWQPAARSTRPR